MSSAAQSEPGRPGRNAAKKKRFSMEQITALWQQAEGGVPVGDVCRQVGVSEPNVLSLEEGLRQHVGQ